MSTLRLFEAALKAAGNRYPDPQWLVPLQDCSIHSENTTVACALPGGSSFAVGFEDGYIAVRACIQTKSGAAHFSTRSTKIMNASPLTRMAFIKAHDSAILNLCASEGILVSLDRDGIVKVQRSRASYLCAPH
jgi:hypothetical protein